MKNLGIESVRIQKTEESTRQQKNSNLSHVITTTVTTLAKVRGIPNHPQSDANRRHRFSQPLKCSTCDDEGQQDIEHIIRKRASKKVIHTCWS